MGSYGARIYVPPYAEPIRPLADPLIWREHSWYGAHIAYKEEEAGLVGRSSTWPSIPAGAISGSTGSRPSTTSPACSPNRPARSWPRRIYIHPDQLRGGARNLPAYEAQTTFPNPWPGGWWRLRDIVERQKISAWAILDLAARNKETVLWNAYLKAKRQTERGAAGQAGRLRDPGDAA